MWKSVLAVATLFGLISANDVTAASFVLDFNGTVAEAGLAPLVEHSEDGFTVKRTSSRNVFLIDNNLREGDPEVQNLTEWDDDVVEFDSDGVGVSITRDSGDLFNFDSVEVGGLNFSLPETSLTFTGHFGAGGSITEIVTATVGLPPVLALFDGFEALSSLVVTSSTDNTFPIMDNFTLSDVSAVPVPAALPLLATAIGGLGFFRWRKRRNTA